MTSSPTTPAFESIFKIGMTVTIGLGHTEYEILWVGHRDGALVADLVSIWATKPRRRYGVPVLDLCY